MWTQSKVLCYVSYRTNIYCRLNISFVKPFIVSNFVVNECDVLEDDCIGWNVLEKDIIQIELTYAKKVNIPLWCKMTEWNWMLLQGCTNLGCQVTRSIKSCMVAPNVLGVWCETCFISLFCAQKFGADPRFLEDLWTLVLFCDTKMKYFENIFSIILPLQTERNSTFVYNGIKSWFSYSNL